MKSVEKLTLSINPRTSIFLEAVRSRRERTSCPQRLQTDLALFEYEDESSHTHNHLDIVGLALAALADSLHFRTGVLSLVAEVVDQICRVSCKLVDFGGAKISGADIVLE